MTLRHKLLLRAAALVILLASIGWLVTERSLSAAVAVGTALVVVTSTFRSLVIVHDDVVSHRGLLGWSKPPVRLDELTAVSLRNRVSGSIFYWPLTLELTGEGRARVNIDCWAWTNWQELAHRAGHFARQLEAHRDPVTDHRLACKTRSCPLEARAAEVVGSRRAGPPPDQGLARLTVGEAVPVVAVTALIGFVGGFLRFSLNDEPDTSPLQMAFVIGGTFGGLVVVALVWAKIYDRYFRRSPPNHDPPPRAW